MKSEGLKSSPLNTMTDNNLSNNPANPANTPEPLKIDVIGEKTAERYAIVGELLKTNLKGVEIAKLTDYTPEHLSRLKSKLSKIQLVTPKRLKKAIQSVEYFADIKNYQGVWDKDKKEWIIAPDEKIKPSDSLNASKVFIDRQYPITQVIENHTVTHNIIDLSIYRNTDTPVIDVSPVKDITPDSVLQSDISSSDSGQVSSDSVSD